MNSTLEFLNQLRSQDIQISVADGQIKINAPQGVLTPELKYELKNRKSDIMAYFEKANRLVDQQEPIVAVPRVGNLPVSFAQERLWFLEKLNPGEAAYHIPFALVVTGKLDIDALQQSTQALINRHETLRTTFREVDGQPVSVVHTPMQIRIEHLDTAVTEDEAIRTFIHHPFDLSRGPLFRLGVYQRAEEEHVLVFNIHHMIVDGWSLGIIVQELFTLYACQRTGTAPTLPPLPLQFIDFAHWQRRYIANKTVENSVHFWREQLAGAPAFLDLPTDYPRPHYYTTAGDTVAFTLPPELAQDIKALSHQTQTTLYMLLLAAFQALLYRYSQQEDLVIGSPVANRAQTEVEKMIGFFTNTLALRAQFTASTSFASLLTQVRTTTLQALAHQAVPFDKVVETLQPERNPAHNPIYQVLFALQNNTFELPNIPGLTVTYKNVNTATSKLDLFLEMWEEDDQIAARLEYNTALFSRATIVRMSKHFQTLLAGMVAAPDTAVSRINLVTNTERAYLLKTWNQTETDPLPYPLIHKRFETCVRQHPQAAALEMGDEIITYEQLNQRANQLAHYLQEQGIGPDALVGIFLPRSVDVIVAVLGVLKAGGAYLPLDPIYPHSRRAYMLGNANAQLVLTHQTMQNELGSDTVASICLDTQWPIIAQFPDTNPVSSVTAENLIYVIYTSGSTGKPKGVALPHRAIANLINWQLQHTILPEGARTIQFTSLSFDVSCQEIFTALCAGDTLVLITDSLRRDMVALANFLHHQEIARLYLPFIALQQLAAICSQKNIVPIHLREIITAGEQPQLTDTLRHLFRKLPDAILVNQYGPTESHVVTAHTVTDFTDAAALLPPIGKPIDNTQIYLLDAHLEPVPVGIIGELYIGGTNVAQGYINQPEITATRFIPNPFADLHTFDTAGRQIADQRLYRTGDLARYLPDGTIQYLGRGDNQVKLRGYRIELSEVEMVLASHSAIRETAVIVREDTPGDKRLVAYVTTTTKTAVSELRQYLQPRLPEYMLPSAFVFLDKMPLTPSGKVNRRALPEPEYGQRQQGAEITAPRTELETQLVALWQQVLKVKEVGIHDNFFELGGHSLLALRLFFQIDQKFGVNLPLITLFKGGTIEHLAAEIRRQQGKAAWSVAEIMQPVGDKPPFFCIHGITGDLLWFRELAQLMAPERPFVGLRSRGLDGVQAPLPTIEAMAACYINEIRQIQPEGPYYLGGASFGGTVVLEVGQQLKQQGQEVALLVMFDHVPYNETLDEDRTRPKFIDILKNLPYWAESFVKLGPERMFARLQRQIRVRIHSLQWKRSHDRSLSLQEITAADLLDYGAELPEHRRTLIETNFCAMNAYFPQPYDGPVLVFRAKARPLLGSRDPVVGWQALADGKLLAQTVPGSHEGMFQSPNVHVLANYLHMYLEEAETNFKDTYEHEL